MKNILSYLPGTKIRGLEIREWIVYHSINRTSHARVARKMQRFLNLDDDAEYTISIEDPMGRDPKRRLPFIHRVKQSV